MSMSAQKCCVPGCMESGNAHKTLHLFPDPKKDRERFNLWVFAVKGDIIGLTNEQIYTCRRVCHAHFEQKFCCRYNRISNIAVPTLNLPGPLVLQKFTVERRPMKQIQDNMPSTSTFSEDLFVVESSNVAAENKHQVEAYASSKENTDPAVTSDTNMTECPKHEFTKIQSVHSQDPSRDEQSKGTKSRKLKDPAVTSDRNMAECPKHEFTKIQSVHSQVPGRDKQSKGTKSRKLKGKTSETKFAAPDEHNYSVASRNQLLIGTGCHKGKVVKKNLILTPKEQKLYRSLIQTRIKLSKCRNKVKRQSANIKAAKKIASNPTFLATLESFPSAAKIFTLMQFREVKKKGKGRRFCLEEKILALSIYKQAPKGYRFLRKLFILPAPQTLTKLITQANIKPGINKHIFSQLKSVAENMKTEEKLCVLLFDEMFLKASLSYNERKDKTVGFVTDGENTKADFADHAQVFMVRGLIKNYKQAVSYTFSAAATSGPNIAKQIKDIVKQLQETGLIVVATVCDQGANNRNAIKLLLQETRGVYLRKGQEPKDNIMIIHGSEIVPLYDPPHLIKCVRNNLITKNLIYKVNGVEKTAKWDHIEMLHKENPGYKGVRLIPNLTDNHVLPSKISKMKVKFATQVFSTTVGTNMGYFAGKGILPKECSDTADAILFFDNLFDSHNGSYNKKEDAHGKPLLGNVTPQSVHHAKWSKSIEHLKNMKFINKISGKIEKVPTLCNWAWTLEGTEVLLKKLERDFNITSIWMRHLNQDPIENFFGTIRSHGCRDTNPTPEKFASAFTTLLINNISSVHAPSGANCEKDFCETLHTLLINDDASEAVPTCNLNVLPNINIEPLEKKSDPRIMGPLQYISGYFIRNAKKKVFKGCQSCAKNMIATEGAEYINYKEYAGRRWLCSPTDAVVECISAIQDITNAILKENSEKNHLKETIRMHILMFLEFDFINCGEHKENVIDYVINLTSRFFIYNYCKDINKILSGKRDINDEEDKFQIKAKKYFKKCLKRPKK